TIYFGTTDGVIAINPPAMKTAFASKPIYISGIYAENNDSVYTLSEEGKTAFTTDAIKVKLNDISILKIQVSSPRYSNLIYPSYEYTLKGNNRTIHSTSNDNTFSFTDLVAGKYIFTVWERGNTDPDARKTLVVRIIPPVLKSGLAKVLYTLFSLIMLAVIIYSIQRRRKAEGEKHIQEVMQLQQKEVFDNKINFFTNLTHEIRTPLTLIKMPLDKIIKAKQYLPEVEKEMLTIQKNAARLLHLTNELLDMERVETGNQQMAFTRQDICSAVNETISRYSAMLEERKISVEKSMPESPVEMMFGKEAIEKVLSNLISNAIKYGNRYIRIELSEDDSNVRIRVSNDGALIKESEKDRIFQKYVQGERGAGLGLPLAKAIAELHGGTLVLDRNYEDLNSFVLTLPKEHPEQVDIKKIISSEESFEQQPEEEILAPEYDSSRHTILIVEDDPDFRGYLASELS
ncbi:MAG: ATP-binding protein, partial [Bacteroidales bacterium]|nr:ATP-binding protein [Bacteroidales bacterium]